MTFKLFKIFLSNIYSFSDFIDGFKKGPKGIFKNIFLILCFTYLIGVFGFMYVIFTMNTYNSLEYIGQTDLFPGISLMIAFLIVFNFGIISVGVSYYAGNGEEQFLSMPITPKEFFGAKFGVSLVDNGIIGIFLFTVSSGYYGYRQGLLDNPLFYIGTLITAVVSSIFVITVIYFLFIVVLCLVPAFRKRSILNGIASVFIMVMALCIGFFSGEIGTFTAMDGGEEAVSGMMGKFSNKAISASIDSDFLSFFGGGLKGNILPIFIMAATGGFIIFIVIPLLSRLYIKTFEGVSDIKQKKISKEKLDKVVSTETKRNSIFKAMFWRDVKGVLREPTFFANGPLGIILFPLILIFSSLIPFISSGDFEAIQGLGNAVQEIFLENPEMISQIKYFVCFGLIAFTLLCGNLTSVASTSFSREGKGFQTIKALPIKNEIIIKVKFFHAFSYILLSCLITVILFVGVVILAGLPFSVKDIVTIVLVMFFVTSTISILLIIIDMLFDTANPKLNWETPTGAMKQNMNAMFGMLVSLGAIGIFAFLGITCGILLKPNIIILFGIGVVFGIIAAPVGSAYFKYAEKKIQNM